LIKIYVNSFLKNIEKQWVAILFVYHCLFIYLAYTIRINRGISDSLFYWAKTFNIDSYSWWSFAELGTSFMLFLNFPFIKLQFPFWFGFLLYGIIGFLGILMYIKWIHLVFGKEFLIFGINILPVFYFLPNMHFWTSGIGKEPIVFFGLASVFYALSSRNFASLSFIVGSLLVFAIRPHIAMIVLSSIVIVYIFRRDILFKTRLIIASLSSVLIIGLLYIVFQMTHIRYWNWERINYFNEYSILSFRYSGSYVPMLEYNWFYKLFSFYFRPLFYDVNSILGFFVSIENIFILLIHCLALFFMLKFSSLRYVEWVKYVFTFTIICGLIYVQRYANLGIFIRTKMMFQPFTIIALLFIIKQGISSNMTKTL
jgi:hypothetical protein